MRASARMFSPSRSAVEYSCRTEASRLSTISANASCRAVKRSNRSSIGSMRLTGKRSFGNPAFYRLDIGTKFGRDLFISHPFGVQPLCLFLTFAVGLEAACVAPKLRVLALLRDDFEPTTTLVAPIVLFPPNNGVMHLRPQGG